MVANRLKNLVSLTKEAVRDVRQVVEDLVNQVAPRPHPALVRVPVRNTTRPNPFKNSSSRRDFSTSRSIRAVSGSSNTQFRYSSSFVKNIRPSQGVKLASNIWPYSAFRRPLAGGGPFPNGLYRHFTQTNARNFSTYGANFSREAVQNLTASLRCLLKNGGDELIGMKMKSNRKTNNTLLYGVENEEVMKTFKLARTESSNIEKVGCFVEFNLPNFASSIPSMSFIDSEIIEAIEQSFQEMKDQIDRVHSNIQLIFESYGCLPLERCTRCIRIHFPNLESWEAENLLVEIGIAEGIVHTNDTIRTSIDSDKFSSCPPSSSSSSMSRFSTSSTADDLLTDYLNDVVPDLISTNESASSLGSARRNDYSPILSISDEIQSPSDRGSVINLSNVSVEIRNSVISSSA